jgi:hypothetical protein
VQEEGDPFFSSGVVGGGTAEEFESAVEAASEKQKEMAGNWN